MTWVRTFPGDAPSATEEVATSEVGGKAASLMKMAAAGLPVPPGAVLTAGFFDSWFDEVRSSQTWTALAASPREHWPKLCGELKAQARSLSFSESQQAALKELQKKLASTGDALYAVRSSSPEEDLAAASFAGGYETCLGVRPTGLADAVRHCFASSLDERVLIYKQEQGFDHLSPSIAVIVQQQLDSQSAGVGFTLNPLTNDYDEAVIDANWGQGESVVAGLATPDHFVVDKVGRSILARTVGAKQVSTWLGPDGGTLTREGHRSDEVTLDDAQVMELTDLLCRIESLYGRPMDVEWAWADDRLHVLQARPITTWVPLPPEMLTQPGERRRIYADVALGDGLTINGAISPMGMDWMQDVMSSFAGPVVREPISLDGDPETSVAFAAGNRLYTNISIALRFASSKLISMRVGLINELLSALIANIDRKRYRAASRPSFLSLSLLWQIPRVLWAFRRLFSNAVFGVFSPARFYRMYEPLVSEFEAELTRNVDYDLPLPEFREKYNGKAGRMMIELSLPALMAYLTGAQMALERMYRKRSDEERALADKLNRGFTGNVVVEMGIALFRLAKLADASLRNDLDKLVAAVGRREMSPEFMEHWDDFVIRYGSRGPLEMDLSSPRYGDDPALALRQLSLMTVDDESFDPEAAHEHQIAERQRALELLLERAGPLRRRRLRRINRIVDLLAGTRDTPKYQMVLANYAVRKRVLIEARRLVEADRLDAPEHVFDLTYDELERGMRDSTLDLRALRAENVRFPDLLRAQVREFPQLIDSRGKIARLPPREERPGEMSGVAVSAGVARGRARVLHDPHEKPVEKGDVLAAYTTDPGWTPLFANASAILLEVGGILQHGAVIAREYGKPCVVGIERLMNRLPDGRQIEVDGGSGIVRVLDDEEPAAS